ncbi:dihydropteroate synthase [Candidatus Synechococcus calcipolaris G9]|uniref:Dihydropteroate synthase n=1 Tax=Candidatus Synechococcus calcipolaris G9 TaxID=1497997 RepID=A0ABT6F3A9_9SYNE|nr:dihydropteroate synthase [Candidatus Synechococcus calcipolaris]MDG2992333.1 dihydropteroate synthase [Candidatus Synechococcus calcipolaris G9]
MIPYPLLLGDRPFVWGERTYLMGILNITPDSFSDGGEFYQIDAALTQANQLVVAGADILDVGGQSTRPGAIEISLQEELGRVIPVIQNLRPTLDCPISIDTTRSDVAIAAIAAGADIINDVSGGEADAAMFTTVAELGVPYILMHRRGTPETMQTLTHYDNVITELIRYFRERLEVATKAGIDCNRIILDPGIGFAKTAAQNIEIFQGLGELRQLGCPILVGPSRKSFIGHLLNQPDPKERVWGTAAACCGAIAQGVDILRVHDVSPMAQVCRVADALWRSDRRIGA